MMKNPFEIGKSQRQAGVSNAGIISFAGNPKDQKSESKPPKKERLTSDGMGTLYIVATPIGNLKDITLRALEVLKSVDLILAEDTRVTTRLLARHNIKRPLARYDEYVAANIHEKIKNELEAGKNVALLSDAGTPAIADPGSRLVSYIAGNLFSAKIVPVPGPSALTAALSVSGLNPNQFTFFGYPPHKRGRVKFFEVLKETAVRPAVFFESPHRFAKALKDLEKFFGGDCRVIIAKELTKIHEEIFRGEIRIAATHFSGSKLKGEFVFIIP